MPPEKVLAALVFTVCIVMLIRIALSNRARTLFDSAALQTWQKLKQGTQRLRHWRSRRQLARQVTQEAIRRAQGKAKGRWKGNVYTTEAFGQGKEPNKPSSKRDLH